MTPQVGQVYDATKLWNSDCEPRRIVEIEGDVVKYQLLYTDRMIHFISIRGVNTAVAKGSWVLRYPDYMCLPMGA